MDAQPRRLLDSIAIGVNRIRAAYDYLMMSLGVAFMTTLVSIIGTQVFCRYVLGFSLAWIDELSRFLLIWITFLFAAEALRRGEMIALEVLVCRLRGYWRLPFILFSGVVTAVLFAVLAMEGYSYAQRGWFSTSPALSLPMFYVYVAVPIGCGLLLFHVVTGTIARSVSLIRGEP